MCDQDAKAVIRLLQSVERMRPGDEADQRERDWYRATLHGVKLALNVINSQKGGIQMKNVLLAVVALALVGCHKKSDNPPPPADTANVSGSWSGPFTYTYPVVGGPVTSVTVSGTLALTLTQDGLGISGTYSDSTGTSGTVSGNVQNHTFTGALAFSPIGLTTSMNLVGQTMKLIVNTSGITGNGSLTRSTSANSIGLGGF